MSGIQQKKSVVWMDTEDVLYIQWDTTWPFAKWNKGQILLSYHLYVEYNKLVSITKNLE